MPINVEAVNLLQPMGELDCTFFPDNDLDAKIGGWLTQAKAKVLADSQIPSSNQESATTHWVYYLAYSYIAGRFAAMPSSVSVNRGADSVSYGQDRVTYWSTRAQLALAEYLGLASTVTTPDSRRSMRIPVVVLW
jgi:hypothetical protein